MGAGEVIVEWLHIVVGVRPSDISTRGASDGTGMWAVI